MASEPASSEHQQEERSGVAAVHAAGAESIADIVVPPLAEQEAAIAPLADDPGGLPAEASAMTELAPLGEPVAALGDAMPDQAEESTPPLTVSEPVAEAPAVPEASRAPDEPTPIAPAEVPGTPRRPEPVSTEADPARPKKAGWWSRAKATLGG